MLKFSKKTENIITAAALAVFGLALIIAPASIAALILRIIGALVILLEAVRIVALVRYYTRSPEFTAVLLNEILIAVIGLILVINPMATIRVLTRVLGVYLMITSLMRIWAFSKMPKNTQIWVSIVLDILTVIAGFWLLIQPSALAELIGVFLGVAVLIKAFSILISTLTDKSRDPKDNYITTEFKDKSDEK